MEVIIIWILTSIATGHNEQGATNPTGPWPDGHIRLTHDQADSFNNHVDGVRK